MLVNKIIIMEKLEFKNYGLEELSHKELQETEGGFWLVTILAAALIIRWFIVRK